MYSSVFLRQALVSLAPFAHKFMPQAVFSARTLKIPGLVKIESAKRARASTSGSLHLAVPPQPLLVLLDIGRKTKGQGHTTAVTTAPWAGFLPNLACRGQTQPCFILQCSAQAQTRNDRSTVSRAGWRWPSSPNERSLHKLRPASPPAGPAELGTGVTALS